MGSTHAELYGRAPFISCVPWVPFPSGRLPTSNTFLYPQSLLHVFSLLREGDRPSSQPGHVSCQEGDFLAPLVLPVKSRCVPSKRRLLGVGSPSASTPAQHLLSHHTSTDLLEIVKLSEYGLDYFTKHLQINSDVLIR